MERLELKVICLWKVKAQHKASHGYTLAQGDTECLECNPTPYRHCQFYTPPPVNLKTETYKQR